MKCRGCERQAIFQDGLELGNYAIVNFKDNPQEKDDYSSLDLVKCPHCGLVQLLQSVPPDRLYSTFHYLSGINQSMNDALFDIVKEIERTIDLRPNDIVCDVGANDGTLLTYYRKFIHTIAFEPAKNITCDEADTWINDYFSAKIYNEYTEPGVYEGKLTHRAKVVTAIAMFYDLEDPNQFLKDVREILDDEGIFVIQMNDLDSMTQNISVDNICHEHLCYYNMDTLVPLLRRNNLYPINISYNSINGGSIRVVCNKTPNDFYPNTKNPAASTIEQMWTSFQKEKKRLLRYIHNLEKKDEKIWAYGASTRGNTLLQLLGLDCNHIYAIADRNPKKWGKFTAGGNIPIKSEEEFRRYQPNNLLVLPYYFEEEFLKREIEYLKKGGKMIFPLPKFRIWTADKKGDLKVHGLS